MGNFWENRKIYISITSISDNWRKKVKDIKKLGLTEVAVFLTGLSAKEREELYKLIKDTKINSIPFIHLKSTVNPKEINYFIEKYKTQVFNLHSQKDHKWKYDYSHYANKIYIENLPEFPLDEREMENYAGVCIDLSHLEIAKHNNPEIYNKNIEIIEKFECGCNHISAHRVGAHESADDIMNSSHYYTSLQQFNYLKSYPNSYFSNILALELENSIEEQMQAREYIYKFLKDK